MRVLFFVEGFTDIRFVVGLSEICDLTLAVPARAFRESGLDERLRESGARVEVRTIEGGRLAFQCALAGLAVARGRVVRRGARAGDAARLVSTPPSSARCAACPS